MATLEQKLDLVMEFIITTDKKKKALLKEQISELLTSDDSTTDIHTPAPNMLNDMVEDLLKDIGVPCSLSGHDYIVTAIELIISNKEYAECATAMLYPDVAARHDSTGSRVERGIRHAVSVAFNRGDPDRLSYYFGNVISPHTGKITNCEFLVACAKIIARKMRDND